MATAPPKLFIVEFLEDVFSAWTLNELVQMQEYLRRHPVRLALSNCAAIHTGTDPESAQNFNLFSDFCRKEEANKRPLFLGRRVADYIDRPLDVLVISEAEIDLRVPLSRVCLLDMKAERTLCPAENVAFDVFIFGGILGDHPPRGRTGPLAQEFPVQRNLREKQLATDTAVLVTSMIINEGQPLEAIPFLDEPELINPAEPANSVVMTGFSYVSNRYDPRTGVTAPPGTAEAPLMSPAIRDVLLFSDFELQFMD